MIRAYVYSIGHLRVGLYDTYSTSVFDEIRHFTEIYEGGIFTSTNLSWVAKQSYTRHITVTTAATLAEDTHVVVSLGLALLVGRCLCHVE